MKNIYNLYKKSYSHSDNRSRYLIFVFKFYVRRNKRVLSLCDVWIFVIVHLKGKSENHIMLFLSLFVNATFSTISFFGVIICRKISTKGTEKTVSTRTLKISKFEKRE